MNKYRSGVGRCPTAPSAELVASTQQALEDNSDRLSILSQSRKRSTSSRQSSANRAEHLEQEQPPSDVQQENDDNPSEEDQPYSDGCQASTSRSTIGAPRPTCRLQRTEEARIHVNGPQLLHAEASVPFWLEETSTLKHQKQASMGRHIARFLLKPSHQCVNGPSDAPLPVVGERPVLYHGLEHCFAVNIPQVECPLCTSKFEMPPVVARCFGSSVHNPKVYLDIGLLSLFHHLKMVSGIGDTLLCNAWNEVWQYSWLHGLDSHLDQPMQPGHLSDTYRWWRNMFRNFGVPDGPLELEFYPGAFGKCPACCDPPPSTHQDLNPPATPGWSGFEEVIVSDMSLQQQSADRAAASQCQGLADTRNVIDMREEAASAAAAGEAMDAQPVLAAADPALPSEPGAAETTRLQQGIAGAATAAGGPECIPAPHGLDVLAFDSLAGAPPSIPSRSGGEPTGCVGGPGGIRLMGTGRRSASFLDPLLPRKTYATADGGHKLTHYAKCGTKHTAMWNKLVTKPMNCRYFTPNLPAVYKKLTDHVKVTAREKAQATAQASAAAAAAGEAAAAGSGPSPTPLLDQMVLSEKFETLCQAELLAARSTAPNSKSAYTDVKVVVGCVCPHVVPGRGMFLSCPDEECFPAYDSIFVPVLKSPNPPRLDALIIDVGCRYGAHFKHHHPVMSAKVPHVLVGWLHSNAGHNLSCQLKFCGMYYEGMGRCIGEQTEQLWAFMKPHAKTSRYMSLPHRNEYLDDLLEYFADLKNENIAELTCQTLAISIRQKGQLLHDIEKLLSSSEGSSLQRGQPYVHQPTTSVSTDRCILYVKTLMDLELDISRQTSGRTNLAAMMLQPDGAHEASPYSQDSIDKIEAKLKTMERQLKINQRWRPDDLEFQEHFARLCALEISTHQLAIEKEVSSVITLTDAQTQQGVSSRQTEILDKRIKGGHKKIRAQMAMLGPWRKQAGLPEIALTEDDVLHNNLPWQYGGENKNLSLEFLRLKLFKMECEVQRCEEEISYLPTDAVKIMLYFGRQIRLLQAWLMREHTPHSAPSGKVILMYDRMRKLERLYDSSLARFLKCKLLLP